MEKKSKLIYASAVLVALVFGYYLGNIAKNKKDERVLNVYKSQSDRQKGLDDDFLFPLFVYNKKAYYFYNLPDPIQKRLIRERISYYTRIRDVIKSLVVQHSTSIERSPDKKEVDLIKLDDLVTFYSYLVTPEEVETIYQKNKEKFGKNHSPEKTKLDIQIQLLLSRIVDHTKKGVEKLIKDEKYYFENRDPFLPLIWLDYPDSPTVKSSKNPAIEIHFLMNYSCENCERLASDIGSILKEYEPSQISLTLLHFSESLLDKTYYLNKSALCVNKQDKDLFWKYNLALLKMNQEIRLLKKEDLDGTKTLFMGVIDGDEYKKLDKNKFAECLKEERIGEKGSTKSHVAQHLHLINSNFKFMSGLEMPITFVNGRRLNPELPISRGLKIGIKNGWFQIK